MKLDIRLLALGMALIVGGAFELFKFSPDKALNKTPRLAFTGDVRPYSITTQKLAQPQQARAAQPVQNFNYRSQPVAQQQALPVVDVNAENKEAKKEEPKTEGKDVKVVTEADEFEDVIDPKTGQMVRRKKAKTEEEKAKQQEEEKLAKLKEEDEAQQKYLKELTEKEQERLAAIRERELQEANNHLLGAAGGAAVPQAQLPTAGVSAQGLLSAAAWEKKLLSNPSLSATTGFVQSYLNGSVSSTVFYKVVDTMLKDNRAEVRGFGVLALGSTPSAQSFNELADLLKTESAGSAIRPKVDEYLNQYTALEHLDVLSSVMNASLSAFNVVVAIDKVNVSAQKYLSNKADPNYSRNVAYFKPFIAMLETLVKSPDASIVAQAQNTLADLKNLTSTT